MKILLISAMEKERNLLFPWIENLEKIEFEGDFVYCGSLNQNEIVLAKCGIGKVNAAVNTYKLISFFHPDLVVNTGVAGGIPNISNIGDIFIAEYVAYHDVWCGPGTQPGVADGLEVFMQCDKKVINLAYDILAGKRMLVGLICSGDRFIESAEEIKAIQALFPEVMAVDMESAAISHVCLLEGVRFNIIRIISDTPGSGCNIDQYQHFWEEAPEKTFNLLKALLVRL